MTLTFVFYVAVVTRAIVVTCVTAVTRVIIKKITIHKLSIALFPAGQAQLACSHTCTQYIPFTFTDISYTNNRIMHT